MAQNKLELIKIILGSSDPELAVIKAAAIISEFSNSCDEES